MEQAYSQLLIIFSAVFGGVDILGLIGVAIYAISVSRTTKKALKITDSSVEKAFKDAILPKNIKLDVSSKIEKPIKEGLEDIRLYLRDVISKVTEGERLILSILALFSHMKQLPDEVQQQIQEYLELDITEEVKLD